MATCTKFEMRIQCDNAAFEDNGTGLETARILRQLADQIERGYNGRMPDEYYPRDDNGNCVGVARFYIGRLTD